MKWKTAALSDIAYTAGRIGWKGLTAKEYTEVGPYFLSVHSLNHGDFVDFRDAFHISEERYAESPEIMIQKNDILICKDGAGIGKIGIVNDVPGPTTINSSLLLIRPLNDIDPKFLYYKLCSPGFQKIVKERIEGATTPHLYQREINQFTISFPDITEQKHIVIILDQAFSDIEQARVKTEKNLKSARELFESYLQQVFSELNEGWEIKSLETFASIVNGYAFKSGDFTSSNKVKSIKITNVGVYEFVEENANLLPASYSTEFSRFKTYTGDIVIALTRTIISSGLKVAVVPQSYDGALINQRVAAIQVDETVMPKEMLQAFLSTKIAVDYVKSHINELMQPNLSINDLKAFPVPVPPKDKRLLISKQISEIKTQTDKLNAVYIEKLHYLDELKKSILQKAFTGQLTNKKSQRVAA